MKQRQLRLGDVLDDYCPRERRLTNHVIVAMINADVKQTRCTTCEAEHEYKHARVPRQRRKSEPAALYSQVLASATPKKVGREPQPPSLDPVEQDVGPRVPVATQTRPAATSSDPLAEIEPANPVDDIDQPAGNPAHEDGPVHRPLIRAQLPRQEQQGPARPITEFTIRQPAGRPGRFRPRHQQGGPVRGGHFQSNVSDRSLRGAPRPVEGRPPSGQHAAKRHGPGRKRSK
jgi:hypothetical protein